MVLYEHDVLDEEFPIKNIDKNYTFSKDKCITIYTGKTYYFKNLMYNKVQNIYTGTTYKGEDVKLKANMILVIEDAPVKCGGAT